MTDLLNCPFCGGEAKIYECYSSVLPVPGEAARYVASCVQLNCIDSRPQPTRAEAAAFWNRRSSPSAVEATEVLPVALAWMWRAKVSGEWSLWSVVEIDPNDWTWRDYWQGLQVVPLFASPPPASPSAPQGVEVKPLEWRELTSPREDGPQEPTGDIEAVTMIGEYSVCVDEDAVADGGPDWKWCVWTPVESLGHFGDLEEAKAAAQADYRARILSAIQTSPEAGR